MMSCNKSGNLICKGLYVGEEDLQKINMLTRREFSADELYCFQILLCDNDIDRDMEQFDTQTLTQLSGMFLGKTGICDHQAVSRNQMARIYDVNLENFPGKVNGVGEPYCALVAKAYMVRTETNRDLILEIEAGIKKEVSVGCSVRESICSICGKNRNVMDCGHIAGQVYDGKLCYTILHDAADAYEWSFVAVPAQRQAGVMKQADRTTVKKLWEATENKTGVWIDREEAVQLQQAVKTLMEDCEQVRKAVRKELMQEIISRKEISEQTNREFNRMLDNLSVAQMKVIQAMICPEKTQALEEMQFVSKEEINAVSDKRFMI